MKKHLTALGIISISLILDIVTKYLIVNNFRVHERYDFLDGFIRITLVYNRGGVFGIFQGYKNMFLVFSIIVLFLMIVYYFLEKNRSMLFTVSMAFIVSGAIGNIIDRLIPGRPGVVDFVSIGVDGYYRWPAFNVADSAVVLGAFLLIVVFYQQGKQYESIKPEGDQ